MFKSVHAALKMTFRANPIHDKIKVMSYENVRWSVNLIDFNSCPSA